MKIELLQMASIFNDFMIILFKKFLIKFLKLFSVRQSAQYMPITALAFFQDGKSMISFWKTQQTFVIFVWNF